MQKGFVDFTLREVRASFRIVGRFVAHMNDPKEARFEMAEGLRKLFGAKLVNVMIYEGWGSGGPVRIVDDVHAGIHDEKLTEQWRASSYYADARLDPLTASIMRGKRPVLTAPRSQLLNEEEWKSHPAEPVFKLMGYPDLLCGYVGLGDGMVCGVVFHSVKNPWTQRHRKLLHLVLQELRRHLRAVSQTPRKQATSSAPPSRDGLTHRETEVLARLLKGESIKEVASNLGIRHSTAAGYVKTIYRHFDVASRAELMSKFIGGMEL